MINSNLLKALLLLLVSSAMFLVSCTEDDGAVDVPVAGFTFAVDSETGGIVTFTNTSENADTYSWDFGDETTSTLESPTKTYTADGTYPVVLTATNEGGDNTSSQDVIITLIVEMSDTEAPVITLTGEATVEIDLGGEYTDGGATANDNVDGDITSSIVVAGDEVNTAAAGTYTITYDVSDAAGNAAEQVSRVVKVRYPSGLLSNGDFEGETTDPWTVNFGEGNVVPVQKDGTNNFFFVNIETADANQPFLVNLSQVVAIEQGKTYKLSFNASSDVDRTILAGIGLSGGSFASNAPSVSITTTSNRYDLELVASFGEAGVDNRVLFDMAGATGVVVLDNIALVEIESTTPVPTDAPTAPTVAEANVTSLFSDAYTDVTVDTWSAEWDNASQEDLEVAGNNIKKISFSGPGGFLGVDFSTNSFDATEHTHFHMDYWIADAFAAGQVLNPKWSNHADGTEVNAFEYTNAIGDTQSGTWVSLDIPISSFSGTSTRDNLSQFILGTANTLAVVYIDNLYLYTDDGGGGATGDELTTNGDFESGDGTGWTDFSEATGGTFTVTDTDANGGTFSGRLQGSVPAEGGGASEAVVKQANIGIGTVTAGSTVTVSFDMKGSIVGDGGVVFVQLFSELDGGGVSKEEFILQPPTFPTDTWTSFSVTTTVGTDVSGGISLQLKGGCGAVAGCGVDVYFDNVSVKLN